MSVKCLCGTCKRCKRLAYQKEWRTKNAERLREYRQSDEYRKRFYDNRKKMIVSSDRNFLQRLLQQAIHGHRTGRGKDKRPVTITLDGLLTMLQTQNGKCAVTGLQMEHKRNSLKSISIDRIHNDRWYEVGNIHLVCRFVNIARQHFPLVALRSVLDEFVRLRTGQP